MSKRSDDRLKGRETYHNGDRIILTGEIEEIHGGEFALGQDESGKERVVALSQVENKEEKAFLGETMQQARARRKRNEG